MLSTMLFLPTSAVNLSVTKVPLLNGHDIYVGARKSKRGGGAPRRLRGAMLAAFKLFLLLPAAARGWTSCLYPHVDWIAVDQGDADHSGGGSVTGMGPNAFIAGYSKGAC